MNILKSLEWRYATKKFAPSKKLSSNQISLLKAAFNLTATSYGLQPIKLLVISNDEIKNSLVEHCYNQAQVVQCSHLLVICIRTDIDEEFVDQKFDLEKQIRGTSEEVIGGFRTYLKNDIRVKSNDELETFATNQAYIALGNLMTVCALEKIDACPMEGFIPQKIDEVLDLNSKNLKSTLLLPVGFRAEDDIMSSLKKVRIPVSESVIEIK